MADEKDDPFGETLLRMTERPDDITDDDELMLRTFTLAMGAVFDVVPNNLKASVAVSLLCNMCGGCNDPAAFWDVVKNTMEKSLTLITTMREGRRETKQ